MPLERTTLLRWIVIPLFMRIFILLAVADQETISAQSGQNVTLTCQASNNTIPVVEWKRADLGEYVISYRDEQSDPEEQHPTFKNRVDLQDREMKAGDVSLILKDVTVNDAGTYECRVAQKSGESMGLLCNITLSVVDPPGQTGGDTEDGGKEAGGKEARGMEDGSVGLKVGVTVGVIVVAVVGVCFLIYRKRKQHNQGSYEPPV
ncbi:T-cell surface glycoprotein CD4 isoform X2 [Haplochromis burtoni]|uniref:T-cell surface glycoprotein CD4 isoform X2 n=1 Tax=Haplochromis burtoni TaxID=8153 RepID=UPI001C2CD3B0|nr:T-cell surface glycoprotein CD4 isoform X2 [Haplochromis burtoni]